MSKFMAENKRLLFYSKGYCDSEPHPKSFLIFFYKCTWNIRGSHCQQAINNNPYPLLPLITGNSSYNTFEFTFNNTNCLTGLKLRYIIS